MSAPSSLPRIVLVRHGETEWSASGRHTGRTDIPLTERGRAVASSIARRLAGRTFAAVWTSPLARAAETCARAGVGARAERIDDLVEWDYGVHEGRTTAEIRVEIPGWTVWTGGCPGGETIDEVAARADRAIARVRAGGAGDVLVFSHGHFSRILAARWIELPPVRGVHFELATAAIGELGWERETPSIELWNDAAHVLEG